MLAFEPDELRALAEVGPRLRSLGIPSLLDDARSALRKLGADLPLEAPEPGPDAGYGDIFDLLDQALERRKRVSFGYRSLHSGTHATRLVDPYGLFFLGHQWYLVAAEADGTVKNFRLSRMEHVSVNEKRPGTPDYSIPAEFNLLEHARSKRAWELGDADAIEAVVRIVEPTGVSRSAARLGEPVPGHPDERVFRVRRREPFARWVLGFAGAVMPVSPDELVAEYRNLAKAHPRPVRVAMNDTAAQLRRILHLIPICEDDTPHSLDAVAQELGTDRKTLLQDLRALSERWDDPGGFVEGVQVFIEPGQFVLRSDHFRRPMRLTLAEVGALELGLAVLGAERPPDEQEVIARARDRLRRVMVELPADEPASLLSHAEQGADADPEILRAVREGVAEGRMLRIRYMSARVTLPTERIVAPLGLVPLAGASGSWWRYRARSSECSGWTGWNPPC